MPRTHFCGFRRANAVKKKLNQCSQEQSQPDLEALAYIHARIPTCLLSCIHAFLAIYRDVCMIGYTGTQMRTCMQTYVYPYIHTSSEPVTQPSTHAYLQACVYVIIYKNIHRYIYIYTYVYVHTHIHIYV